MKKTQHLTSGFVRETKQTNKTTPPQKQTYNRVRDLKKKHLTINRLVLLWVPCLSLLQCDCKFLEGKDHLLYVCVSPSTQLSDMPTITHH